MLKNVEKVEKSSRDDERARLWRRVDGVSGISSSFHAGSLVTMRTVKYGVSSLADSSVSMLARRK